MLHLTRNVVYPVSQSPNTKPALGSILISLYLLTLNKVDFVVPANQIFSICLFLVLYSLSYKCFLPSALLCSSYVMLMWLVPTPTLCSEGLKLYCRLLKGAGWEQCEMTRRRVRKYSSTKVLLKHMIDNSYTFRDEVITLNNLL